jgi:hypothetical protein
MLRTEAGDCEIERLIANLAHYVKRDLLESGKNG